MEMEIEENAIVSDDGLFSFQSHGHGRTHATVSRDSRGAKDSRDSRDSALRCTPNGSARSLILVSLSRFYANEMNMTAVLPYISGDSPVSLRLIDWFVTNYAKKQNVFMTRVDPATGDTHTVNVYQSYRSQLKAFSKQQFDPFRRRDRIEFWYSIGSGTVTPSPPAHVKTTVGQLNFFRWMLENGILEYVALHAATIEADMVTWQHANHVASAMQQAPSSSSSTSSDDGEGIEDDEVNARAPSLRTARSELSTHAPTVAMMRLGGTRTLAFE